MTEHLIAEIICSVLDWTIKQPLEIVLPKDSKILCILYHNNYDHLYCLSSLHKERETRYFIAKQRGQKIEDIANKQLKYIGSTIDEESIAWHMFELISIERKRNVKL